MLFQQKTNLTTKPEFVLSETSFGVDLHDRVNI